MNILFSEIFKYYIYLILLNITKVFLSASLIPFPSILPPSGLLSRGATVILVFLPFQDTHAHKRIHTQIERGKKKPVFLAYLESHILYHLATCFSV